MDAEPIEGIPASTPINQTPFYEERLYAPTTGTGYWTIVRPNSASAIDPALERDFYALAQQWRNDTSHVSLSNEKANHFAYHQIMAMGPAVLPLIFRELSETTSDWFWALRAIARRSAPIIPEEDRGRVRRIAEIWMRWGRDNGHVSS